MATLAFDTHAFIKELTAAGFSEAQAEAVTSMVRKTREVDASELATKADLAHLATNERLAEAKADVIKWVAGLIGLQTLTTLAALAGLARWLAAAR